MTLLRGVARTLLASYFVVSGVKALRDPEALVPVAEPIADKFVPLVKEYAPAQVASVIPEDAKTLVRVNAAAQVVGGLALATGKGRRIGSLLLAGSLLPSTIAKHPFWSRTDPDQKAMDKNQFLKNISLLGGVLIAAGDTEGRPSLAWRAQKGSAAISRGTRRQSKRVAKSAHELTDSALAEGAVLVGSLVASSRKAKKLAAKEAAAARDAAQKAAKVARKRGKKLAKEAKKESAKQIEAGRKAADELAKEARKQAEAARKAAARTASNIKLGEN
jgi:uncharacterized membrane protein YphA (DoxX/SURF4 family)